MRTRGTGRNDADHLAIRFVAVCMNDNQNDKVLHQSDGMPALLLTNDALDKHYTERILKNQLRRRKVNAMLLFVGSVFPLIPFKV